MNEQELKTLYEQYNADLFRLAKIMLYDESESQDVVSDVFAWLAENNPSLRSDSVRSYLMTSVRNRCVNIINQKKLHNRVAGLYTLDILKEGRGEEDDRVEDLLNFINWRFGKKDRQILAMRFGEGMKYQEIATTLHISEVAVYKHLSQSIMTIREHFERRKKH
jgi:RNA polymerase sigma-70 factor (ECF subfamily)